MIFCFNFNHFLNILSYRFIIVEKSKLKKYKVLIVPVVTWKYKVTVVCIEKGKKRENRQTMLSLQGKYKD